MFQDLDQIRSNFVEKCIKDIFSETFQRFRKKIRYIGRSLSVLGQVSIAFSMTWYEKGPERSPLSNQVPLKFRSPPPAIQGSKVSPFSLSILHMIPKNSPNFEMDEGHIWVWSTIQTSRKQNASNREDFKQ